MGSGYLTYYGVKKDYSFFKAYVDGSLTEVTAEMLDGVTKISDYAFFFYSELTSVNIPSGVTTIGISAFLGCPLLSSVTIPNSVTSIGDRAFDSCSALASVIIPSSVTSIGISVFYNCSALTSVIIPSSITSIANYAFNGCRVLASVIVEATTPPTLGINVFSNTSSNLVIYVPAGSVDTYKAASGWSTYASRIQAIP